MALFDFLTGDSNPDYASDFSGLGPNNPAKKSMALEDLLKDPNILRVMGEVGANLSAGAPVGQALGGGAANLIRSRAAQQGAAAQAQERRDMLRTLVDALRGGSLLTPTGDMSGADSLTVNNDGTYTLKGGRTAPSAPGAIGPLTDMPLEGRRKSPLTTNQDINNIPFL